MSDLLLDRFEKVKTIKTTKLKKIELYINRNSGERVVAKIQPVSILKDSRVRNVLHEASFTQNLQGYSGIPFMVWSGKTKDERVVLLIEELGQSLKDRFQICGNNFTLKTVCMLGLELIEIIKAVHDKGFVISNVSMDIFQFGRGEKCLNLYINDLSECMNFRDPKTHVHILEPRDYIRSPQNIFQSTAVYENREKSRKDDMESLMLMLIYMLKGQLPWSKTFKKQQKYQKVDENFLAQFKNSKKICEGIPKVFLDLLQECRSLLFQQQPSYHWCILKLKSIMYSQKYNFDFAYDWLLNKQYSKYQVASLRNPNIHLDKDDEFIQYLEQAIFPYIDADDINTKYEALWPEIEKNGGKSSSRTKNNDSLSNKMESPSEKHSAQDQKRPVKKTENTKNPAHKKLNQSVIERKKKKKQQCAIM